MATSRKNILFISHSAGWQGGEKALAQLVDGLSPDNFSVSVVLPDDGVLAQHFAQKGIQTYILPLQKWVDFVQCTSGFCVDTLLANVESIRHIIDSEQIDIVHTNTSIIVEGAIAAYQTGTHHVWHLHEFITGHPALRPRLPVYLTYRLIDLLSDTVVTVSRNLYSSASIGVSPEHLISIPNGIDPLPVTHGTSLRQELGIPLDAVVITTIGHLIQEKGHVTLLQAAINVLKSNAQVVFLVVGEKRASPLGSYIEEQITKNNLEGNYFLLGYRQDIPAVLAATDIYVCSSVTESFSLALLEAMSLEKAVVATRCGGPDEIVIDGETGLLVPIEQPESMASALSDLIQSPDKRARFGKNGKKRFQSLYTRGQYCRNFEELYCNIAKRKLSDDDRKLAESLIELLVSIKEPRDEAVEALLNSMSWRITAPLRKLYDLIFPNS